MPPLDIQPFAEEHVEAAGALLAARHRAQRTAEPLLPERFEDPAAAAAMVEAAWRREGVDGAVALRDGRVVAYLLTVPGREDHWGPSQWVELAGHAAAEGESEAIRDLYAQLAGSWVDAGRTRHYALAPAGDRELLEAWYRLSFGQQHAVAIREVEATPWPEGVRPAEPGDVDATLALTPLIARHQALAPVFSDQAARRVEEAAESESDEVRADIEADIAADDVGTLVAEADGRIVGFFEVVAADLSSDAGHAALARPERAAFLGFAATQPEARGSGAGVRLTQASLAWAHERGYDTMVTDWRVTNLLSSRFWPRRGFRPTFLRLYRALP